MAEEKKLPPKRPTAKKRDIQNERKQLRNKAFKSSVKTATKSFLQDAKNTAALNTVYALLDKGVKKGIFHANKAAREKSKLAKKASA